jgi:hypothetical protein
MALGAVLAAGCRPAPPTLGPAEELASPAGPGSGQPFVAAREDGSVLLSWVEAGGAGHRLRLASRARGSGFGPVTTVAEGDRWFVNWADFPQIAALPGGATAASWLERSGTTRYAYEVRVALAGPDGRWTAPVVPHRDRSASEHGFVSLVPADAGGVGVVWLDGRRSAGRPEGEGETLVAAAVVDAQGAAGPESFLDERVCDCCQTAAARTDDGVVVAYRDRGPDEIRDISVVRFAGGRWSEPRPVHRDGWRIDGCPVNGPALDARGRAVAVAWFTAPAGTGEVKLAFSTDAGQSFASPMRIDGGEAVGRVDVVLRSADEAIVSWLEKTPAGSELRVRRARRGTLGPPLVVAATSAGRASGVPRMDRAGDGLIVAWTDPGPPARVRVTRVGLPD